jgi:hypothetical protein
VFDRPEVGKATGWLGGLLGQNHPEGSELRNFTNRQDLILMALGALVVLVLLIALIF